VRSIARHGYSDCTGPRGQGATEYLILLAVVLIVALVSVALLGFFPGLSADAQLTQSQAYWKSAYPLSVIEVDAYRRGPTWPGNYLEFVVRNNAATPIKITKILSRNNNSVDGWGCWSQITLAPGQQIKMSEDYRDAIPICPIIEVYANDYHDWNINYYLHGAKLECNHNGSDPGLMDIPGFGFEYEIITNGQSITKRQIGAKNLLARCRF
jgi:hypothetical protein